MPDRLIIPEDHLDAQEKRVIILRQVLLIVLIIWVIGSTSALLYNAYVGSQTRATLVDCVQPTGKCAQRNQQATGQVVDSIIKSNRLDEVATRRIVVITESCGSQPDIRKITDPAERLDALQSCVDRRLKEEGAEGD